MYINVCMYYNNLRYEQDTNAARGGGISRDYNRKPYSKRLRSHMNDGRLCVENG